MLSRVSVWFGALVIAVGAAAEAPVTFTDVTTEWGVRFEHNTGAFGQKYLPETMGSGVAVFDLEGDNDLDILFVNGMDFEGHPTRRPNTAKLYVKSGGAFEDKTRGSGLDVPMYGIGVATGDFDNDGDADVYVSCLGDDRLFRNEGGGKFADVTRQAGIKNPNFGAGVAWFDFDNDGWLDLYVCNYVEWTPQTDIFCTLDGTNKSYCTPESYKGVADILYRNNGNGTFTDVSKKAGVYDPSSKSLGVVAFDYNNDGRIDLFVSNDTEPAKLYDNLGGGKFEEVGMISGVAFNEMGVATAGMGVDAADYDRSGRYSIVVGNFSNEMVTLFKNEGNGLFIDAANETRIGQASLLTLTFGAFFFDADGDGWLDLFLANGHVENEIAKVQSTVSYAQPMHLFQNRKNGKEFVDIAKEAGL
ncbi:MAG: VCBS repeat-containing protein [Candidatus Poribacteria bacterium]|nr:VCBS repeat-containing protein [Candidatus Poribacteria bacterium]